MNRPPQLPTITIGGSPLRFNPRWLIIVPLVLVLIFGILSSFYTVSPESVAVVQRFGKHQQTATPGLHFKLPYGIDTATVVPVRRQLKLEFGLASPEATNPDQISDEPDKERDLLTIESAAYRREQEIKGRAYAEATGIYSAAYNSSPAAADFYQFTKTLETYQKTLGKDTTAILTSDSELFRLFKSLEPEAAE